MVGVEPWLRHNKERVQIGCACFRQAGIGFSDLKLPRPSFEPIGAQVAQRETAHIRMMFEVLNKAGTELPQSNNANANAHNPAPFGLL